MKPIYRDCDNKPLFAGDDTFENMLPACKRCNTWKRTFTVEEFRAEIEKQVGRLYGDSAAFRLAHDFGVIKEQAGVTFFF